MKVIKEDFNFFLLLMSSGLPLMKSVLIPLTKTSVMPLGITGAASATDTAIQKNLGFHDKSNSFK